MQNMISVEGFLREIYPLEYTLSENIDTADIVAESFGDIRAKVQGAVRKLIEWIKKVIRMIREKVASIMSRLRKPPRIVGKNRPDKATEAWVAPSDLVVPDTIQDAVREALKSIEILTGQSSMYSMQLYDIPKLISDIAKDTETMFDKHEYDPDDKSSDDSLAIKILSAWRYVNACGPEMADSDLHEAKTIISDAMNELDISTAHFVAYDNGIQPTIDKYFSAYSKLVEKTKSAVHDIETYYSDAELNKYFQRLYNEDEVSETYINDKITAVHSNISKCTSTLNRLLGVCSGVLGILDQCAGLINKYSR